VLAKKETILAFEQKKSFQQRDTEDNICRIVKHIASNVKGRKI
jgi:hypothetical protein